MQSAHVEYVGWTKGSQGGDRVVVVEEGGVLHVGCLILLAAVLSHVEVLRLMAQPVEVAHEFVAQEGLAAPRQPHQDDDEPLAVDPPLAPSASRHRGGSCHLHVHPNS